MTREERDAIRTRCNAASPWPWRVGNGTKSDFYQGNNCVVSYSRVVTGRDLYTIDNDPDLERKEINAIFDFQTLEDIKFIAHSHQDIPALLDALEEMEADRDRWKARADALERSILSGTDACTSCRYFDDGKCEVYGNCGWEFDEARFAPEMETENLV